MCVQVVIQMIKLQKKGSGAWDKDGIVKSATKTFWAASQGSTSPKDMPKFQNNNNHKMKLIRLNRPQGVPVEAKVVVNKVRKTIKKIYKIWSKI